MFSVEKKQVAKTGKVNSFLLSISNYFSSAYTITDLN